MFLRELITILLVYRRVVHQNALLTALEKALDSLPFIKWEYCKAKSEPLKDEELEITSYSFFSGLYIHFEVIDAPDQSQQIQAKAKIASKRKIKKINK